MGLVGRNFTLLAGSAAVCALCATAPVMAQDDGSSRQPTLLQRLLLIGGSEAAGTVSDTPLATQTTAEEIEENQIESIEDLGNTTEPGVNTGFAGAGVNIRGLEADRVLTTIDNIPIPYLVNDGRQAGATTLGASTRADGGIDTFDFSSLSTVDIMRGSDSSRAGSGALGGAMVLRTLEPDNLIEDGKFFGGITKLTYDSANRSFGGSMALAARRNGTSALFQGGYKLGYETDNMGEIGGQGPSRTEPNPMDFDQHNLMFKLRQDIEGGYQIGVTAERYRKDTATDLLTDEGASRDYSELDGDEVSERNRISLDFRYDAPAPGGFADSAEMKLYWQQVATSSATEGVRTGYIAGPWYRDNDIDEQSFGLVGNMEKSFEAGGATHEVTVGGNASFSQYGQYLAGEDACPVGMIPIGPGMFYDPCSYHHTNQSDMPDVDAYRLGLFVDDRISFGDGAFSLTPGIRFDWYDYRPQETPEYLANSGFPIGGLPEARTDYAISPKLRAEYQPEEDVTLFAQWAMGFKAPNVSELYLSYASPSASFGSYQVIGNPDLVPETSHGFEIGADLGDEQFGGRVSLFYNRYRNFIAIDDDQVFPGYDTTQIAVNLDRVRIYGFDAEVHRQFDNGFSLNGAVAYAQGEDLDTGEKLGSVPPLKAILGLGYATESWGTDLRLIGVAGVDVESDADFKPEGYGLANLTGWWEPQRLPGLRIAGGVYNLFDEEYYDALKWRNIDLANSSSQPMAYYSEPGRSFRVSLTQRF